MQIELSPEDEAFLREYSEQHRIEGLETAIGMAIQLLRLSEEADRRFLDSITAEGWAEINQAIDLGDADIEAERVRELTPELIEGIRRRVRAELISRQPRTA